MKRVQEGVGAGIYPVRSFPCLDVHGALAACALGRHSLAPCKAAVSACAGLFAKSGISGGCIHLDRQRGWHRDSACRY